MALLSQSGGGAITPGVQTLYQQYGIGPATPGGVSTPGGRQQDDPYLQWENHFQRTQRYQGFGPDGDRLPPSGLEGQAARPGGPNKRVAEERDILIRDRKRLANLAKRIGINLEDPGALGKLWLDAVDEARGAALVNPGTDPWEILESWARTGTYAGAAKTGKPKTLTQTQRQVNLTNAKTAREVIRAALRARLDRDPRPAEIAKFIADLNAEERANPTVSTTTSKYDAEGNLVSSDTQTKGGAPAPGDFAEGFLTQEHDPEADAVRAGQEYFSVAQQLVQAMA
jgi:hypothetical protein